MRKNRLLSLLLALVMLFGVVSALGVTAMAEDALDTPYGWWEADSYSKIKWKLIPVSGTNTEVRYYIRGYYEIEGITSTQDAFSVCISFKNNKPYSSTVTTRYLDLVKVENGFATLPSDDFLTFWNVISTTYAADKCKLWFTVYATINYGSNRSDTFRSGRITLSQLKSGVTSICSGPVTYNYQSPNYGLALRYTLNDYAAANVPSSKIRSQWQKSVDGTNGWTDIEGARSPTYTISPDDVDSYLRVVITGDGYAGQIESDPVHVNRQDIRGTVAINPANPKMYDRLTPNLGGAVAGVSANKLHYQWQVLDNNGITFSNIGNEAFYNVSQSDVGKTIRLRVSADGWDGSLYSDSVKIAAGEAFTGVVTVSPSNPVVGNTLTANLPSQYNPNLLHCQWQKYNTTLLQYQNISGATGRTYTPGSADAGSKFRVAVTADLFDGTLYSDPVTVSAASNPPLTGTVTVSPTSPKPGDTLTAKLYDALAVMPSGNLHYQWQRYVKVSGVKWGYRDIPDATDRTYSGDEPAGTKIRVKITADGYDGAVYSELVTYASGGSTYPKGDVDRSGQVGNSDLIMVARHVVHIITLTGEQFTLGDMDNDKVIDNKDIISVARKVVGL